MKRTLTLTLLSSLISASCLYGMQDHAGLVEAFKQAGREYAAENSWKAYAKSAWQSMRDNRAVNAVGPMLNKVRTMAKMNTSLVYECARHPMQHKVGSVLIYGTLAHSLYEIVKHRQALGNACMATKNWTVDTIGAGWVKSKNATYAVGNAVSTSAKAVGNAACSVGNALVTGTKAVAHTAYYTVPGIEPMHDLYKGAKTLGTDLCTRFSAWRAARNAAQQPANPPAADAAQPNANGEHPVQ